MRPTELLFSQTTIKSSLTRGEYIPDVIQKIDRTGDLDQSWFPIEIARDRYDGRWYAQNNRRLYILRVLEVRGRIGSITVSTLFQHTILHFYSNKILFFADDGRS